MPKRNKIYFSLRANGVDRELLWLKERKPGQLLIVQREPKNFGFLSNDPIGDAHYSIHAPDHGSVTTITRKMEKILPSGERDKLSMVTHVPENPDGFAVPLMGIVRCNLSSSSFDPKFDENDRVISLGNHDPNISTLVYCLVASKKPRTLSGLRDGRLRFKQCETPTYEIGIIYGYQHVPSNTFQTPTNVNSKSPKINGTPTGDIQINIDTWTDKQLLITANLLIKRSMAVNYMQMRANLPEYQDYPIDIPGNFLRIHKSCRSISR